MADDRMRNDEMLERSRRFQRKTQGPGRPMTYGNGEPGAWRKAEEEYLRKEKKKKRK